MEDSLISQILAFLVSSFLIFAIIFYTIKACRACCRFSLTERKSENEQTVLEEITPSLLNEFPDELEDERNFTPSVPQIVPLITQNNPERQFLLREPALCLCSHRPSGTHLIDSSTQHTDDPPSYEEAVRMSLTAT